MKINRNIFSAISISAIVFISGCYPGGPEFVEDYDLTLTNYSQNYDFKTLHTYALPDSIVKIGSEDWKGDNEFVDPTYADQILDKIRTRMNENGWTEVQNPDSADVNIFPSSMTSENLYYYYDWGYWYWYYGYYPGWGWYYPGYYPPTYVSGFTSGSFLVQMSYPAGRDINDQVPILWTMIVNGIAEGTNTDILNRVIEGVDQGFNQSPYLKK